ncbi:uncharacterized protein LOC134719345 [Mytilus trossulus]|uniref:uncharacterized protein LOC134719345 n=1 Tax=Mytilus trossulus TaxID=6551 RepID=UPI00300472B7
MENVFIFCLTIAYVKAGSCYYQYYFRTIPLSEYRFCLTGCCGPKVPDDRNYCCPSMGATIGIVLALILFIAIVIGLCMVYRRRKHGYVHYRNYNPWTRSTESESILRNNEHSRTLYSHTRL